jgi:hypothetical protein
LRVSLSAGFWLILQAVAGQVKGRWAGAEDIRVSEELLIAAAAATVENQAGAEPGHPDGTCINCQATLAGPFCHACGQKRTHLHKPFWELMEDFLHSVVHFDGRLWQTLRALFLKPGQMTLDWIEGRQMRHVPPIRLFIFTTLFLIISLAVSDVALVRIDGHLASTLTSKEAQQAFKDGFQIGDCQDGKSDEDCIKGKGNLNFEGNLGATPFELKQKNKTSIKAIEGNMAEQVDDARAKKLARLFQDYLNSAASDPSVINKAITGSITTFVLLATPIMALLLKLFYIRRKKYLAEHVFFALHVHTFFFASLLVCIVLVWVSRGTLGGWAMAGVLWMAYSLYFLLALKRAYGQGWIKTVLKSMFVTGFYITILFTIGVTLLSRYLINLAGNVSA